uniref:Reverse transcriptase Ty1/copia-type domain-containing protein n=1 Tax=Tanacetum cinerariifolium TaxID=118510 RepID=A0A699GLE1_TANCI|nr:hypothetical protein [Tanacetum cinerariifolium]
MMGELKFFLGLQVYQSPHGIFISQSQYAIELLKKIKMDECDSMSTPMATARQDADLQGTTTAQTKYHSMIGGLMYLTTSRPDIAYATFACARYQARPMDYGLELIVYSDANHVGCHDDYKSTLEGLQFLGEKLVSWSSKKEDCTAMSTTEAKYIAIQRALSLSHAIWFSTRVLTLPTERFEYLVHQINMRCMTPTELDCLTKLSS